ncbi:MAG: DUF4835 family protein [Nonlabens sp.]
MKLLKIYFSLFLLLGAHSMIAQELNASVQINAQNIAQRDQSVFKTLEESMQDFLNNTKWTDQKFKDDEKINCSLVFVVTEFNGNRFKGNFQVSASRPIFNSSYVSPIFNFKDNDIDIEYTENEPLFYNDNQFNTNLISLLSYYAYTIIAIDADTFELKGGQQFFEEAQNIVNLAQGNSGASGWRPSDGLISRFRLTDDILSDTYKEYRQVMYKYHRKGMDTFAGDQQLSKNLIKNHLLLLNDLQERRPNSLVQRVFFDAKADEIADMFSGGPKVDVIELKEALQKLSPNQSSKWRRIKV